MTLPNTHSPSVIIIDITNGSGSHVANNISGRGIDIQQLATSTEAVARNIASTDEPVVVFDISEHRIEREETPIRELVDAVRSYSPDVRVGIVLEEGSSRAVLESVSAGAEAVLLANTSAEELAEGISRFVSGEQVAASELSGTLISIIRDQHDRLAKGTQPLLTKREIDVLSLVAQGKTNRQIARELYIADNTVKNHVRNILEKLGCHSRMEAVDRAIESGIPIR